MKSEDSPFRSRREFLRKLAMSPLLAATVRGDSRQHPTSQPVKSVPTKGVQVRTTIEALSQQIRARAVSPVELTRDCLQRIEHLNPKLNAFITVLAESALAEASRAEEEIHSGHYRGPLHGIPIGLKDIVDTAGVRTTAASALFKDRIPTEDAAVVRRLRDAGAIILGKQNLHEFAYGGSCMISFFGEVHNPWDTARITGGSSGGSAASVAAGMGIAAIGTDTAGSIRLPAAYCGVVGLKATHGRVSARGVIPLAWSYDHVGPIACSVFDAAAILQVLAGYDLADPASVDMTVPDYMAALDRVLPKRRIGVPRAFFFDDIHPEIAAAIEKALEVFRGLKIAMSDVKLDVPTDRTLSSAEAYAYHESFVAKTPDLYQPATLARIQSAANTSAATALRARRDLDAARHSIRKVFDEVDILLTPAVPIPPPAIADLKAHPENLRPAELLMLRNTRPFNVWGLPTISIPCGFTSDNLPIGLQLAAAPWQEELLLQVANAYEKATDWHTRIPTL